MTFEQSWKIMCCMGKHPFESIYCIFWRVSCIYTLSKETSKEILYLYSYCINVVLLRMKACDPLKYFIPMPLKSHSTLKWSVSRYLKKFDRRKCMLKCLKLNRQNYSSTKMNFTSSQIKTIFIIKKSLRRITLKEHPISAQNRIDGNSFNII